MTTRRPSIAALLAGLLLAGCGGTDDGPPTVRAARDDGQGPLTAVIVDVSSSTATLRAPGGPWESQWLEAAKGTAAHEGVLWATTADGASVSRSVWNVQGHAFKATIDDNELLADAELARQAEQLLPADRQLMAVEGRGGSDLLGALQVAARLFRDFPDRPRNLVLLTDGGITADGVNLMRRAPASDTARAKLLKQLQADGRLPDISGGTGPKPRVWIGGLGHDAEGNLTPKASRDIIAFWEAMIPAAGAELVSADSASLRLIQFP